MSNYQIKLTPVSDYFFGSEKHVLNKSKLEAEYFAKSQLYPQQTALLGLLRYYLLMINDCLNPKINGKEAKAKELIGVMSFEYGFVGKNNETEQTFGKIKSISPLYFLKGSEKYIFAPFSYGFVLKKDYNTYCLNGYKAKDGYSPKLINLADSSKTVQLFKNKEKPEEDYIFIDSKTVGNKKGTGDKTEDDGFYKQDMYQLNKGWAFAFDAEIDTTIGPEHTEIIIPMGAEKRLFKMNIEVKQKTDFSFSGLNVELPAIFCISDCFVEEKIFEKVTFAVNQNVSFRNLISSISSTNYSRFSQKNKGYKRSNRYNLMKRGSIFYFEDETSLNYVASLFKNQNAENIGFNKIQILKPINQ